VTYTKYTRLINNECSTVIKETTRKRLADNPNQFYSLRS